MITLAALLMAGAGYVTGPHSFAGCHRLRSEVIKAQTEQYKLAVWSGPTFDRWASSLKTMHTPRYGIVVSSGHMAIKILLVTEVDGEPMVCDVFEIGINV